MHNVVPLPLILALVGLTACDSDPAGPDNGQNGDGGNSGGTAGLRVVHTIADVPVVDVLVGGAPVLTGISFGQASQFVAIPAGSQPVAIRAAGGSASAESILSFPPNDSITLLTVDSSSVINPWVLTDSGSVVPPDKSKLRAVHFAAEAPPIDIWRTQPDFPSLVTIQFPFRYQEASPYIQSDPGDWSVLVTTERRDSQGIPVLGDSLLAVGPISIPTGESRTVLVLDDPGGGVRAVVITP